MGGNAGTQSLAVAVRALATRDLTAANVFRVVRREALVGLAMPAPSLWRWRSGRWRPAT